MFESKDTQTLRDVLVGTINLQWLILELLAERDVVPRNASTEMLKRNLKELEPDLHSGPDAFALRHVLRCLSGPSDSAPRRGWTPMVLEGGKGQEPQDPHEGQ